MSTQAQRRMSATGDAYEDRRPLPLSHRMAIARLEQDELIRLAARREKDQSRRERDHVRATKSVLLIAFVFVAFVGGSWWVSFHAARLHRAYAAVVGGRH